MIEKASQFVKVIALHCGVNDPAKTHPWRIGNIARSFPKTKILMIHMGGAGSPGLYDAAIKIAQQFPNITLVATEADPKAIKRAIKVLGASRVCYGSDEPFTLMKLALAVFKVLLEDLSAPDQKLIMGQNILKILSL